MDFVQALWLPILVSAAFVWFASFLFWMVLPNHKGEWGELPDERGFMGALVEMGVKPGQYIFPCSEDGKRMNDPGYQELVKLGPMGSINVWDGPPKMGLYMMVTFLLYAVISLFVAYVAYHTLQPDMPYLAKFRITGAMAVAIYTLGRLPNDVWFRVPRGSMLRGVFDGVIYGLLTAGTFGWLWKA